MTPVLFALVGVATGLAGFWLRRRLWPVMNALGWVALAVLILGAVGGFVLLAWQSRKGGDYGMAAVTFVIFAGMGLVLATLLNLLAASIQASRLGRKVGEVSRACWPDVIAGFLLVLWLPGNIYAAEARRIGDERAQTEITHRQKVRAAEEAIPEQFRGMPYEIIRQREEQARQVKAEHGIDIPQIVPPDVAAKMRTLEQLRASAPTFTLNPYQEINERQKANRWYGAIGWLVGVFVLPFAFPKPAAPTIES